MISQWQVTFDWNCLEFFEFQAGLGKFLTQLAGVTGRRTRPPRRRAHQAAPGSHDAGAVPPELLTTEQDRIAGHVAFLDSRTEASEIEYDQDRAHLDDCLALAGSAHAVCMSIDAEPGLPFDTLLNPEVQTTAPSPARQQAETRRITPGDVVGVNNDAVVPPLGFEPRLDRF